MQLTSKEQALLSIAVDRIVASSGELAYNRTQEMWCELYDEIINADIDDVGEEYDPALDYDFDLDWDVDLIKAFALDMEEAEDDDDKNDCVNSFVEVMDDTLAWKLYHALNNRFDAEFERQAEAAAQAAHEDQLDLEDAINKLDTDTLYGADVVIPNGKVVKDRFNRFSEPEEAA